MVQNLQFNIPTICEHTLFDFWSDLIISSWSVWMDNSFQNEIFTRWVVFQIRVLTEKKSFGDIISKIKRKSFSIIQVHIYWHKYLHDGDGIPCQLDIAFNIYFLQKMGCNSFNWVQGTFLALLQYQAFDFISCVSLVGSLKGYHGLLNNWLEKEWLW